MNEYKIDFVLPWVDPNDIEWQKSKALYSRERGSINSESRYRDMNTLKYVLRSIEKFCPWYNKIYLITAGHYPNWLNLDSEKIKLVTHSELYFDKTHLPIFNSSSIEMNILNIEELSEYFIYLNDDTFILKDTQINRFFQQGLPVDFLSHAWLPRNSLLSRFIKFDEWIYSVNNNLELVNSKNLLCHLDNKYLYASTYSLKDKVSNFLMKNIYKKALWLTHWHHPQPYKKETLQEVYKSFKEYMMISSNNKFRKNNDLTQYLYRYWHLLNGKFIPIKYNDALHNGNITSLKSLKNMFKQIRKHELRFACFNDSPSLSSEEFIIVKNELNKELEKIFPKESSFELIV